MREWADIVAAYEVLRAEGKPCALATVVNIEGSAYRRPGARMLVAEDGRTWGGVSGGCLERDVADRARGVIASGRPFIYRYDTSDEELIARGVTTGCGGTIDVLLQSVNGRCDAIEHLGIVLRQRRTAWIATLIRSDISKRQPLGETLDAETLFQKSESPLDFSRPLQWVDDPDDRSRWFVERLAPPQRLVIVGGGPDAVPVVSIAKTLGWHVAVVAARPALALHTRFAIADEKYVTGPEDPLAGVPITSECAVVVMTHNLARDAAALAALPVRPRYLGLLGPRHRTDRAVATLPAGHPGRFLHSPIGLDIGSDSPEEIALSIIAEVQACVRNADARPLHAKPDVAQQDAVWVG